MHVWPDGPESNGATASSLIAALDTLGIARAAVVTPGDLGWDNSGVISAVQLFPKRLVGIGRLDLAGQSSAKTLERQLSEGLAGIRIGPSETVDLDSMLSQYAQAVWRTAAEARAPVHFHLEPRELRYVREIAVRFPELPIVIDHLGRPDTQRGADDALFTSTLVLAELPNVWVKTPASGAFSRTAYPYLDLVPFLDAAIAAFGPERVMWGSDWPRCLSAGTYAQSTEPLLSHQELRDEERDAVFSRNFERLYGGADE